MNELELQDCLHQMEQGDRDAFRTFYATYKDYIYRTVLLLVNRREDAADVVSEVYMALFRSLQNYNTDKPFQKWLNGLIVAQTSNWNRKLWRRFRLHLRTTASREDEPITQSGAETTVIRQESEHELLSLVQELPSKLRSVVIMRYYQEYSFQEVADVLDIPLGTAKSRHHQAIARLRKDPDKLKQLTRYYTERGESL
ncbi:sigma-70 family RNA polymerase sigma factor [Paenibacillus shenyangensis]|uniref:sigma-70 family RNA polymerase sigma factor n=1 Tax=Paenibacillus sp. A9 TaxID=1284352 RepID=UPI00037D9ADC|nr:sigma-70 family RNA polymerase sigma factor [Paenibacillus sp. A9]